MYTSVHYEWGIPSNISLVSVAYTITYKKIFFSHKYEFESKAYNKKNVLIPYIGLEFSIRISQTFYFDDDNNMNFKVN